MSNLLVTPELVAAAAADLAGIGSAIGAANAAAGAPTMALLAAGADEVSAAVAAVFSSYAQQYQTASAAAAAFHDQFTRTLLAGAGAYAGAEAANVEQQLLNAIPAAIGIVPSEMGVDHVVGRPDIALAGLLAADDHQPRVVESLCDGRVSASSRVRSRAMGTAKATGE